MTLMYAEKLRVFEGNRDASDKIMGFIYQDMLTVDLVINSEDDYSVFYSEWIEDIFIESQSKVQLYQVKYYPGSQLYECDLFNGMYYQFLKKKLYESSLQNKECEFHVLCHAPNLTNISRTEKNSLVIKENNYNTLDLPTITSDYECKSNLNERKDFLILHLSSTPLLDDFDQKYSLTQKSDVRALKTEIMNTLYSKFLELYQETGDNTNLDVDNLKDLLFAISIQFVHKKYYSKPSAASHTERGFSKSEFFENLASIIKLDSESTTEKIVCYVLSLINDIYTEIIIEHSDENTEKCILEHSHEIYSSTIRFFEEILSIQELRLKLLNTIGPGSSLFSSENFNSQNAELVKFFESHDKLKEFVTVTWKIMLNICNYDFSSIVIPSDDHYIHKFATKNEFTTLLVPSVTSNAKAHRNNTLKRVVNFNIKPDIWFLKGCAISGTKFYTYSVVETVTEEQKNCHNISRPIENDVFTIKCLGCIDIDEEYFKKDNKVDYLFVRECIKGAPINENR